MLDKGPNISCRYTHPRYYSKEEELPFLMWELWWSRGLVSSCWFPSGHCPLSPGCIPLGAPPSLRGRMPWELPLLFSLNSDHSVSDLCALRTVSPHAAAQRRQVPGRMECLFCSHGMPFCVFPHALWLRLFVFLLLFTLSQSPKCLRTTWLSLLLGKQPRWLAVQLIQSSYKGCKDRPADRLNKAWAETAWHQGTGTQFTAQVVPGTLGRAGKCICPRLCPCL